MSAKPTCNAKSLTTGIVREFNSSEMMPITQKHKSHNDDTGKVPYYHFFAFLRPSGVSKQLFPGSF